MTKSPAQRADAACREALRSVETLKDLAPADTSARLSFFHDPDKALRRSLALVQAAKILMTGARAGLKEKWRQGTPIDDDFNEMELDAELLEDLIVKATSRHSQVSGL